MPKAAKPNKQPKKTAPKKIQSLQITAKKRTGRKYFVDGKYRAAFLRAFEDTAGNISAACELAGIERQTYYRWMKSPRRINEKFRARIVLINAQERFLDFAEGALLRQIQKGDTTAIIFYLKTKGRERGYIDTAKDIEFDLAMRAATKIIKVIERAKAKDSSFEPEIPQLAKFAADDFGIKAEIVERETMKLLNKAEK